ncbi:Macrolide-specific efflux protein MacA [Pseudomonas chlororaphis subsp. aurantiaca]|uniref:Macrolide transporter subunit MacA n=1 Tax=Pseudomonas chlororaphis subsp. aurantiaca TaxID=86192 RepID=A0AAJ0ZPN6_9PSED|nr:macrolide transporter subunit MacA [Pseudomonas chlororaphis]AZD36482.1 Macrolide-specific efflux protein MacA [Pseudomonas chlororaphis subsp. aurantiaca]AZD42820.1 Macrolide-specific efflux protein MacA [Pseudomonas chlororaphis subsp. aurantiaca]AZD67733.1 Macrolide-specific efflux protein MacA [Pseudomonas chlororaphis subsp. aurantiaca]AZD73952.1 Macrolide-specific efflux protein MacA [Pseudomonas chlororaphis subsp. aurantiaca]AZD80186.1 Macrolide-specific efflux protein MacA [Pseudom
MEKSKFRKIALGLALAVVAGLIFYAVRAPAEPPQYLTAKVERGDIENAVLASGLLEGIKQVDVGAQVSGQLKSLKVKLGDKVKKGQWLAEIDPLVLRNTLRQAQVDEENLQAQRRATIAQLKETQSIYERYLGLQEDAAISKQEFETATANYEVQRANLLSLDAQIKNAHIQIDTAKVNLAYTRIVAPIDGDVVGIVTQEGQTVIANQLAPVLLKLADLDTMTVKAQVSEADVIHISPGQEVYFTILGEDRRYYGKLRGTEPAPQNFLDTQPAGTPKQTTAVFYNALFDVPNPDHRLRISMTAQVRIVLDTAKDVLTVPVAALGPRNNDGSFPVRVLDARGQAQSRNVQTGINNNVKVQIKDGLAEGDRVVIGDPLPAVAGA